MLLNLVFRPDLYTASTKEKPLAASKFPFVFFCVSVCEQNQKTNELDCSGSRSTPIERYYSVNSSQRT